MWVGRPWKEPAVSRLVGDESRWTLFIAAAEHGLRHGIGLREHRGADWTRMFALRTGCFPRDVHVLDAGAGGGEVFLAHINCSTVEFMRAW